MPFLFNKNSGVTLVASERRSEAGEVFQSAPLTRTQTERCHRLGLESGFVSDRLEQIDTLRRGARRDAVR